MQSLFSSIFLIALQSAAILAAPLEARGEPTPDVGTIKNDIQGNVQPGTSIFYTGSTALAARNFGKAHGLKWLQQTDTATGYNDPTKWDDWDMVVRLWSQAFAELSTETVWVTFKDLTPIDPSYDSVWNQYEYPALTQVVNGNTHIDELIQVSAADLTQQIQIWPVDVRTFPTDRCAWHGDAPICAGSCPDGTYQVAQSLYGTTMNKCITGHKVFCCDNSVMEG